MSEHSLKEVVPMKFSEDQAVIQNYGKIVNSFRGLEQRSMQPAASMRQPISNKHGFYIGGDVLTSRIGGLDKLFYTLIQGVVEDPDYALKKDNRIYERMLRDPQIYYCLNVRKSAVSSLPWLIKTPNGQEKNQIAVEAAQAAEKRLRQIPRFNVLVDNILDALLPGLSINELVWKVNDQGEYVIANHYPMSKDRFKFDINGKLKMRSRLNSNEGTYVPEYKFISHTYNITDGSWDKPEEAGYIYWGKGLADTPLYHYFYFKLTVLKFLMQALERTGNPSKILYTGAQNTQLASRLHEIMLALKNDSVVTIPGSRADITVDTLKLPASKAPLFMVFIEYIDQLITRAILGQDLMTEMSSNHGSFAAANVHKSVFHWISNSDKQLLIHTLNSTLLSYDTTLNTPNLPKELQPQFEFKSNVMEDTAAFLQTVQGAISIGLTVSEAQVRELTGLKEPSEGEAILGAQIDPNAQDPNNPNMETQENESDPGQSLRQDRQRIAKPGGNGDGAKTETKTKPVAIASRN